MGGSGPDSRAGSSQCEDRSIAFSHTDDAAQPLLAKVVFDRSGLAMEEALHDVPLHPKLANSTVSVDDLRFRLLRERHDGGHAARG